MNTFVPLRFLLESRVENNLGRFPVPGFPQLAKLSRRKRDIGFVDIDLEAVPKNVSCLLVKLHGDGGHVPARNRSRELRLHAVIGGEADSHGFLVIAESLLK